jgi:hypothetical protein
MSFLTEREGSLGELYFRKVFTSPFYFRGYRRFYPLHPFYTPGAIRYLSKRVKHDSNIFEWGAGVSTLWFAQHGSNVIAVEHNENWFKYINQQLKKRGINNSKVVFLPENAQGFSYPWKIDWKFYPILGSEPKNPGLKNYIFDINKYPDAFFDIIVIDGRERLPCLFHARDKLKQTGILVFDDSARPRYKKCFTILKDWYFKQYNFGLKQTTIFARNKNSL